MRKNRIRRKAAQLRCLYGAPSHDGYFRRLSARADILKFLYKYLFMTSAFRSFRRISVSFPRRRSCRIRRRRHLPMALSLRSFRRIFCFGFHFRTTGISKSRFPLSEWRTQASAKHHRCCGLCSSCRRRPIRGNGRLCASEYPQADASAIRNKDNCCSPDLPDGSHRRFQVRFCQTTANLCGFRR